MAKTCSYANCTNGTYGEFCLQHKPRKPLARSTVAIKRGKPPARMGKVAVAWYKYRKDWIKRHGGDEGRWICALQCSPLCKKILTIETLTLDHIIPRSRRPDLRYEDSNMQPACFFCNSEKGSRVI